MRSADVPSGQPPQPFSNCWHCGSGRFNDGKLINNHKEIYCAECGAGYRVHVNSDGVYLINEIERAETRWSVDKI